MASKAADVTGAQPLLPQAWIVSEATRETADVVTLTIQPGEGVGPMAFKPGQFNMLYAFGTGEVPISISGDPAQDAQLVHTLRAIGFVTRALCALQPGDVIGVRGPYGSHWPIEQHTGRDIVLVAGGIGLAPLRPTIYHILSHRDRYGEVVLLYGARKPEELLFSDEFEAWRKAGVQVEITVDNADACWEGRVGVVTTLIRHARFDQGKASAFICGPEVMMRFTAQELENKGVAPDKVYISMERNMKCAIGLCGHCQLGPEFICTDGAVFALPRMKRSMAIREL